MSEKNGTGGIGGGVGGLGTKSEEGGVTSSTGGGAAEGGGGGGSTKLPPVPFASLKTQLMIITAATAALLFVYDGLQVRKNAIELNF